MYNRAALDLLFVREFPAREMSQLTGGSHRGILTGILRSVMLVGILRLAAVSVDGFRSLSPRCLKLSHCNGSYKAGGNSRDQALADRACFRWISQFRKHFRYGRVVAPRCFSIVHLRLPATLE